MPACLGPMLCVIPAIAIVLSQATQPAPSSKSHDWCFDRGQGVQLCEETEAACKKLPDARELYRVVPGELDLTVASERNVDAAY